MAAGRIAIRRSEPRIHGPRGPAAKGFPSIATRRFPNPLYSTRPPFAASRSLRGTVATRWFPQAGLASTRCPHFLVNQVDGLERTDHDLEFDDQSRVVPLDQVDAVDFDGIQLELELEHGVPVALEFTDVPKGVIEKNLERRSEILFRDRLADLRRVDHGRIKGGVVCQQSVEASYITGLRELMPNNDWVNRHERAPTYRRGMIKVYRPGPRLKRVRGLEGMILRPGPTSLRQWQADCRSFGASKDENLRQLGLCGVVFNAT